MKKNENKFHAECIAHLLKIGATFERYAGCALQANFNGAKILFFDSEGTEMTEVLHIFCRDVNGKKTNFFSIYSRAESLKEFKQHIAQLLGPIQHFGYVYQEGREVIRKSGFWSLTFAADAMRQARKRNARLFVLLESGETVYLS